jgi:hypothetical protein
MSFKHSVCRWCFEDTPLRRTRRLVSGNWHQRHRPTPSRRSRTHQESTAWSARSRRPRNTKADSAVSRRLLIIRTTTETLLEIYRELIPQAAEAGIPNVITFSGNREGLSDEQGLENCARGLEPLLKLAEEHDVTLIMELLNSKSITPVINVTTVTGELPFAKNWARPVSNCSMTFTTCRSWKVTLWQPLNGTPRTSGTIIPPDAPGGTNSILRRNSTTPRLSKRLNRRVTPATLPTSSSRPGRTTKQRSLMR